MLGRTLGERALLPSSNPIYGGAVGLVKNLRTLACTRCHRQGKGSGAGGPYPPLSAPPPAKSGIYIIQYKHDPLIYYIGRTTLFKLTPPLAPPSFLWLLPLQKQRQKGEGRNYPHIWGAVVRSPPSPLPIFRLQASPPLSKLGGAWGCLGLLSLPLSKLGANGGGR